MKDQRVDYFGMRKGGFSARCRFLNQMRPGCQIWWRHAPISDSESDSIRLFFREEASEVLEGRELVRRDVLTGDAVYRVALPL